MEALDKHFVISRVFDAPRDIVWKVHTEAEHLKHWWGPKGFKVTYAQVDLRPGGLFHYCLQMPDGGDMWAKWVFKEIAAPERLVFIFSFSDEGGGIATHAMSPTWPREVHSVMTFTEEDGRTRVTIDWIPQNATEIERKTFAESLDSMRGGFTGTFERLAAYLARIRG